MDQRKTYEGMFLLDAAAADFEAAAEPIRNVLDRNQAEILSIKPWEDRRLAYEIAGKRRGLYVLTYFKSEPGQIVELERDCQLNEHILRVLVLRRDQLTQEQISAETPVTASLRAKAEQQAKADEKADKLEAAAKLAEEADAPEDASEAEAAAKPTEEADAPEDASETEVDAEPTGKTEPPDSDAEAGPAEDEKQTPESTEEPAETPAKQEDQAEPDQIKTD